jgi:membrane-associated protease RseP (regulator of RpoE activity)
MLHRTVLALGALLCLAVPPLVAEEEPAGDVKARNGGYIGMFFRESKPGVMTIERIHPGSGAEKAGLKAGDVVLSVDGRELANGDQLIRRLWSARPFTLWLMRERGKALVEVQTATKQLDAYSQVGAQAPRFRLPLRDGSGEVALDDLLAKGKPVVLVFGSFT